ncbi:Neural-cadherin [Chionoecetes opilio]|uniref:Neural-cadherin n=1 Tax=Chionoecetes opilio TaxID=41210 RepID=A0A8J4YJV1_CHIOP|nr:Neural-cadherin [Chionoecetes opilio]
MVLLGVVYRCGAGQVLSGTRDTCEDEDECAWDPCLHGGTCLNKPSGFLCQCASGFSGRHCHLPGPADTSLRLSLTALVATVAWSLLILLVVCALLLHQHHRRAALRRGGPARVNGGERTARPNPHGANGQPAWTTTAVREPGEWDVRECLAVEEPGEWDERECLAVEEPGEWDERECLAVEEPGEWDERECLAVGEPGERLIDERECLAVEEPGEWDERECLTVGEPGERLIDERECLAVEEPDVLELKVNHKHPGGCPITLEETGLYVGKVTAKRKGGENGVNSSGDKRKRGGSDVAAGDDLRNYSYEGEGSSPGSLSSCLESCGGSAKFLGGFREVARALESWEPPSVRSTHSTPTKMESSPSPTTTLCSTHHPSPISGHHTPCPPTVPAHTMPPDLLALPISSDGVSQGFPTPES